MLTFLGGNDTAGIKLKESGSSHWINQNMEVKNEYGFSALPGGYLDLTSQTPSFKMIGHEGRFWDSSGKNDWYMVDAASNVFSEDFWYRTNSYSVRCLKD